jgi:hypothetical protein
MAEIRHALCRGAAYGTDESAAPHGAHEFFPHAWGEATRCPGWNQADHDAASLIGRLFATDPDLPGLVLRCHPVVEYAMMKVIIPGYREFIDELSSPQSMPLQKIAGIRVMRTVSAERGAWELASDKGVLATGLVRDA